MARQGSGPDASTYLHRPLVRFAQGFQTTRIVDNPSSCVSPTVVHSRNLREPRTPTVVVIEQLVRAGWERGVPPRLHLEDSPKFFGQDKFSRSKFYLQCLTARQQLADCGLAALPSGESEWYYRAILAAKHPAQVPRGQSVKKYKALLDDDGQAPEQGALEAPRAAGALCDMSGSEHGSDSSEAIVAVGFPHSGGYDDPQPEVRTLLPPILSGRGSSGQGVSAVVDGNSRPDSPSRLLSAPSPPSSTDSGQSQAAVVVAGQRVAVPAPRPPVHDCIKVEEHLRPGQLGHYRRYTTQCPLAQTGHCAVVSCGKRRNCGQAQMGHLGPAAPEAFLMVWRNAASSFASKADHQRWSPTIPEVRRFMIEQGWTPGDG